jgi:hypothetical protein
MLSAAVPPFASTDDWREKRDMFEHVALYPPVQFDPTWDGTPERIPALQITEACFVRSARVQVSAACSRPGRGSIERDDAAATQMMVINQMTSAVARMRAPSRRFEPPGADDCEASDRERSRVAHPDVAVAICYATSSIANGSASRSRTMPNSEHLSHGRVFASQKPWPVLALRLGSGSPCVRKTQGTEE